MMKIIYSLDQLGLLIEKDLLNRHEEFGLKGDNTCLIKFIRDGWSGQLQHVEVILTEGKPNAKSKTS